MSAEVRNVSSLSLSLAVVLWSDTLCNTWLWVRKFQRNFWRSNKKFQFQKKFCRNIQTQTRNTMQAHSTIDIFTITINITMNLSQIWKLSTAVKHYMCNDLSRNSYTVYLHLSSMIYRVCTVFQKNGHPFYFFHNSLKWWSIYTKFLPDVAEEMLIQNIWTKYGC